MQDHWNSIYTKQAIDTLGWYQDEPQPDFDLIQSLDLDQAAHILVAGAGATTLIEYLIEAGYTNLTITDISQSALDILHERIGSNSFRWIQTDLADANSLGDTPPVDLWYDRAVLHFLVNPTDRKSYFATVDRLVINRGYVLLGEFSEEGASKCSGLPVHRYSVDSYRSELGSSYQLVKSQEHLYIQPSGGERPFIYAIFQKR